MAHPHPHQHKFTVYFRGYTKKGKLGRRRKETITVDPIEGQNNTYPEQFQEESLRRGIIYAWQIFGQVVHKIDYHGKVAAEADAD